MNKVTIIALLMVTVSCTERNKTLFEKIDSSHSGVDFSNDLTFDQEFNVYTYRNYYNGGGVAIGDVNNDGLPDIYFTANLKPNRLYLNKGNFQFDDITETSKTSGQRAWSTGVTMADVNGDGWLDIYVCNSGDIQGDNKQNELFINNGDLTFTESASEYGLDDMGFSTQASFFDYDKDGDLDAYLLNNSYQAIGSFDLRRNERPKRDKLGGDKLLRNEGNRFVDASEEAGIYGSIIGFGLGVTVGDVNGDNWDDIYVSNDFFERDYLYLNNQDGTFSEDLTRQMNSISGASMGADLADVNNDGQNDLFVTEMLPSNYERLKTVTTFEDWNRQQYNLENGYYYQYTRNTLQLNNGDSSFAEIGRLAGVEATDWSWGALIFDFENDGYKDLFVANGIYQDLTNQDYLQYVSNEEVVKSIVSDQGVDYKRLIEIIPSNPIANHAFHNNGDLTFKDNAEAYGLAEPGFSNGSAYGDLDNDGDLDLVVNNVNMPSWIYRNNSNGGNYLKFELKGSDKNTLAIGAKIRITSGENKYYIEQQPVRGFQSSVDPRPIIGLKSNEPVDIQVIWPSNRVTELKNQKVNRTLTLDEKDGKYLESDLRNTYQAVFNRLKSPKWKHDENVYVDFHRERLLWHMNSTSGPRVALGDVNGDGLQDFYVGGSKEKSGKLFIGNVNQSFSESGLSFEEDAISEDSESIFIDVDNDGDQDLIVTSGGVEFSNVSSALYDRLYLNNGTGGFRKVENAFSSIGFVSTSTIAASDFDQDGDMDLFMGEGSIPGKYGLPGSGFLFVNESGVFREMTSDLAPHLKEIGLLKDSEFVDVDMDGDDDLVVTGDFMGVLFFENEEGKFTKRTTQGDSLLGWWNRIHAVDIDGDGDKDFVLGNHGLNSRFKASRELPIELFLRDFDKNGSLDQILGKQEKDGKIYPYALRHNLIDQIKSLKKLFPDYESFKNASIQDIFDPNELGEALRLKVNTLESVILVNNGNFGFAIKTLPVEAQISPVTAIASGDFDRDGDPDLLLGGNLYATKPEVGRYDASNGIFLVNDGNGNFQFRRNSGFKLKGEIREIVTMGDWLLVARNSDSLALFRY